MILSRSSSRFGCAAAIKLTAVATAKIPAQCNESVVPFMGRIMLAERRIVPTANSANDAGRHPVPSMSPPSSTRDKNYSGKDAAIPPADLMLWFSLCSFARSL